MAILNPGKTILITRPESEAESFAREVGAVGFVPLVEPLLVIEPLDYKKPDSEDCAGLIFTSANAVRVFGCPPGFADMAVFCVGERTAEEVSRHGYARVITGDGDGARLAALIAEKATQGKRLLHVRGEHTAVKLEEVLSKNGIMVDLLPVYTARMQQAFTPECREALENGALAAVTFFSKRTAETFLSLIEKEGLSGKLRGVKALCISESVLECVREIFPHEAYSTRSPDRASMIELITSLCGAHRPET